MFQCLIKQYVSTQFMNYSFIKILKKTREYIFIYER